MNGIIRFLKVLENSKKKQMIFVFVSMVFLLTFYFGAMAGIKCIKNKNLVIIEDDFSWVYQFDGVKYDKGKLIVDGIAFELNTDAKKNVYELILRDVATDKCLFSEMIYKENTDVNEYFLCGYNYNLSGFDACFKTKRDNWHNGKYEILLRVKGRKTAYSTGVYISGGRLIHQNEEGVSFLEVEGTELEQIVNNGRFCSASIEEGVYVYQYAGNLYWITEPWWGENEENYIQYQLETTQIEKLPKERLDKQWYWDNISFLFEEYELKDIDTGKYRVAKKALPTTYSITKIWTGEHDEQLDEWIWKTEFRPYYEFVSEK